MKVIILAAGRGTRLGELTKSIPKTLLPIHHQPLIKHILNGLISFDIDEVIIVGGFQYQKLVSTAVCPGLSIKFIENKDFHKGSILSIFSARSVGETSFCIMNSDHFYSFDILSRVFNDRNHQTCMAVCDFDRRLTDDDMKIKLDENKKIKCMSKKLTDYDGGYIGMSIIPQSQSLAYWKAVEALLDLPNGESLCVEEVMNYMASSQNQVGFLNASGSWWFEVDTTEDLMRAQQMIHQWY